MNYRLALCLFAAGSGLAAQSTSLPAVSTGKAFVDSLYSPEQQEKQQLADIEKWKTARPILTVLKAQVWSAAVLRGEKFVRLPNTLSSREAWESDFQLRYSKTKENADKLLWHFSIMTGSSYTEDDRMSHLSQLRKELGEQRGRFLEDAKAWESLLNFYQESPALFPTMEDKLLEPRILVSCIKAWELFVLSDCYSEKAAIGSPRAKVLEERNITMLSFSSPLWEYLDSVWK